MLVRVTADDVSTWAENWPGANFPEDTDIYFEFDSDGNMVDLYGVVAAEDGDEPVRVDLEGYDGGHMLALSEDAQAGIAGEPVAETEVGQLLDDAEDLDAEGLDPDLPELDYERLEENPSQAGGVTEVYTSSDEHDAEGLYRALEQRGHIAAMVVRRWTKWGKPFWVVEVESQNADRARAFRDRYYAETESHGRRVGNPTPDWPGSQAVYRKIQKFLDWYSQQQGYKRGFRQGYSITQDHDDMVKELGRGDENELKSRLHWIRTYYPNYPLEGKAENPSGPHGTTNSAEAQELKVFIKDHEDSAVASLRRSIAMMMAGFNKRKAKGTYDHMLAVKGMRSIVDRAVPLYRREYGYVDFNVPTRTEAAQRLVMEYEDGGLEADLREENPTGQETPAQLAKGLGSIRNWNTYAGGTSAPPGKHSYDAYLPGGNLAGGRMQYTIDPITNSSGRMRGYQLSVAGHPASPGLHFTIGMFRSPQQAATAARKHYGNIGQSSNPSLPPDARELGRQRYQQALQMFERSACAGVLPVSVDMTDGTTVHRSGSSFRITKGGAHGGQVYLGSSGLFTAHGPGEAWLKKYSPTGKAQS